MDPSGAVVTGARVVIIDETSHVQWTVTTTYSGTYEASGLPVGHTYTIYTAPNEFTPMEQKGVRVEPGRPTVVDFRIRITGAPEEIEVTATKLPEDVSKEPTPVQVFTGDELRDRGARDLSSALSRAIGVEVAPGGDSGPASSVPEFWGLKEFDAFLLIVDGVPSGGAFNPALTALDLADVDRIEILRGPAPVAYGATSFVGVVQVVHKDPESTDKTLTLRAGDPASGGGSLSIPIRLSDHWASRLTVAGEREGYTDDRTSYRRGYGSWRVARKGNDSRIWFDSQINWLDQSPASPRLRDGLVLVSPVDANYNPAGAFLNDHRGTFTGGFDRPAGNGRWSFMASVSHDGEDILRGFLVDFAPPPGNAHGFRQQIQLTDVYLDSHYSWKPKSNVTLLIGVDFLHGTGTSQGADFDYDVPLDGSTPGIIPLPPDVLDVQTNDHRNFGGLYGNVEWSPFERLRIDAGLRLNGTVESQTHIDPGAAIFEEDSRAHVRPGANVGAMFTAWQQDQNSVGLYINYRDTFKPAAIDFGIETFAGHLILDPETARSVEGGLKGYFLDRRMEVEASGFLMDFNNLVTSVTVGGLPGLTNAGSSRFQGFEGGASFFLRNDVIARATYSFHDDRFTNFVFDFGGGPVQLAGNRLEMSPRHLAAFGINYVPAKGFTGGFSVNYSGDRYLNKRNTALAPSFVTVGLSAGYRTPKWEIRADATNLGDQRDPVAESELGDAQYYLQPSRRVDVTLRLHF